jgi:MFS family permease
MIVSVTGTWMQTAAQAWLVYELSGSAFQLGLVGACGSLPMLMFTLPAGVIADRLPKRNIVLLTQTASALQACALAALAYSGFIQVWHIMLLAFMLGVINSIDMPTRQAMVSELTSKEDLMNAVTWNSTAFNAGRIVGPAIGGVLIAAVGAPICFLLNGLSFASVIGALALIPPRPPGHAVRAPMLTQLREGLTWARQQPLVAWLLVMTAIASIFGMAYATLLPALAKDVFHTGPKGYGFLLSSVAVGALSSALLLSSFGHRWPLGRPLTAGTFLFPLALLGVAAAPRYALAVFALFLLGFGLMSFNALSNTLLQRTPPDELRGRIMGLRAFLFAGMTPLANLQIGATGEWLNPRIAIAIGGAICLLSALIAWKRVPELRRIT